MSKSINLQDLKTYSGIYNLGLTDVDVTHLSDIHKLYQGKMSGSYIYKETSKSYELVLRFNKRDNLTGYLPRIHLITKQPRFAHATYPFMVVGEDMLLHTLPTAEEAGHIGELLPFYHKDPDGTLTLEYNTIAEAKSDLVNNRLAHISKAELTDDFAEAIYYLAGVPYPKEVFETTDITLTEMPDYAYYIKAVCQFPNDTRVAFIDAHARYSYYYGANTRMSTHCYVTKPGDAAYNWTDPDRYCSHLNDKNGQPQVCYKDPNMILPKDQGAIDAYRRGHAFLALDKPTVSMLQTRWMRKQQDLANEKKAVKELEGKLKEKINALTAGGSFSYNDMSFTTNSFEYENQVITDPNVLMADVLSNFYGNYSDEYFNFERVFDTWLNHLVRYLKANTATVGKIGDVNYTLKHIAKKNKQGITASTFYINDNRINKDEIQAVLSRAVCFPTTDDFNNFCESVAACSLRYHKILASGIEINVHDEIFDERINFKISLERVKNKNFISFNKKKYKISDTNKLLSLTNATHMSKVISVLLDEKCITMTGDEIKLMLDTGKALLIDQRNRETELLESTMKQFGIEKIEDFIAANGKNLSGYHVKGKMREYLVESSKCMVYEYPSGRYICMVDKGQNEHTNVARLVNRFYALSNDSKLATEISTL